ncbi:MAG: protease synthase and sporulation negative regulatory protein 1 [Crocinitomicaceae bacterium]|jgi:ribosomal protein S18 acetylase RimI-like enzyme|nr:protease synthase and sporulation negative regulatory protein 1 [Crocinitomicaceae bacterium]
MIEDYELTPVTLADIPELQQLGRRTFADAFAAVNTRENMASYLDEAYTAEKLSAEISNPGSYFWFLHQNDKPVAYLKLNTGQAQTEFREEHALEIERIYVLKELQGKQIGQRLLDFSLDIARQLGKTTVWLGVWENNTGAIRFYERNGFERFGSHVFHLGDDPQTDILMKLNLKTNRAHSS